MTVKSSPLPQCVLLKTLRWESGLPEKEVAPAAGVSLRALCRYERHMIPPDNDLNRILPVFGYERAEWDEMLAVLTRAKARRTGAARFLPAALTPVDPPPAMQVAIRRDATEAGLEAGKAVEECRVELVREVNARQARAEAEQLCSDLLRDPKPWLLVDRSTRFQTWAVAEALAHRSEEAASGRADRAIELAALAYRAAELCPHEEPFRKCLLGYTLTLGENAVRAAGDIPMAGALAERAEPLWKAGAEAGARGPLAEWRLQTLQAALLRDQLRFGEALARLDVAWATAPEGAWGRILISKSCVLENMGEARQALTVLDEAERLVDSQREPLLYYAVRFNRAASLCRLAHYGKAELALPEIRSLAKEDGRELLRARVLWLSARVAAGLGRSPEAEAAFKKVRHFFVARRVAWDGVRVSLELAELLCRQGRSREALSLFEGQGISRDARAALDRYCAAAEKSAVTREQTDQVLRLLQDPPGEGPPGRRTERPGTASDLLVFAAAGSAWVDIARALAGWGRGAAVATAVGIDDTGAVQAVEGHGPQGGQPRNPPADEVGGVQGACGPASRESGRGGGEEDEKHSKQTPNDGPSKHDGAPVTGGAGASSPGRADRPV